MEEVRVERKWVEVGYGENRIRRKRVGKGMGSGKEKTRQAGGMAQLPGQERRWAGGNATSIGPISYRSSCPNFTKVSVRIGHGIDLSVFTRSLNSVLRGIPIHYSS